MRHKHADAIIAWAEGAKIQGRNIFHKDLGWTDVPSPCWDTPHSEYRIKRELKPDVEKYYRVYETFVMLNDETITPATNLKLTWDGETGKLKKAEVI